MATAKKKGVKKAVKKSSKNEADKTANSNSKEFLSLQIRYQRFVLEYLKNGLNAVDAYMTVYPKSSYNAASVSAYHLLRNPKIQAALKIELDSIIGAEKIEIERGIFRKIKESLKAEISDYLMDDGSVDFNAVKKSNPTAVHSIDREFQESEKFGVRRKTKIRLVDGLKAAELGAKILGMMKDEGSKVIIINPPQGLDAL